MLTIILGVAVGLAYIYYRYSDTKKKQAVIEQLSLGKKFECYDFSRSLFILTAVASLLPLGVAIYFTVNYDVNMLAFMIALFFMFIAELINAKTTLTLHYNKTAFIINGKLINYKSLKNIYRKTSGRYLLVTFNGEHLTVAKAAALKIMEVSGIKLSQ